MLIVVFLRGSLLMFLICIFFISSSFIIRWLIMECCTLGFIRIICFININQKFSSVARYFLIQSLSSSLFLLSLRIILPERIIFNNFICLVYNFSLSIKIGLFPFHFWVLNLVSSMGWVGIFLLARVQKIIPILILRWWLILNYVIFISFITMVIRIYYRLGLNRLKIIFICSILSHRAWIRLIVVKLEWWLIYIYIYRFLILFICLFNSLIYIEDFRDLIILKFVPLYLVFRYCFNLLSLIGMPPLVGFVIKWILLDSILVSYYIIFIVVITSVVHLYYYFRVILWSLIFFSPKGLPFTKFLWGGFIRTKLYILSVLSLILNLFFIYITFYLV